MKWTVHSQTQRNLWECSLLAGMNPVEIPVEDKSTGETVDVRIGTDHVTVIEFEIIEPFILGSDTFELSSVVCNKQRIGL